MNFINTKCLGFPQFWVGDFPVSDTDYLIAERFDVLFVDTVSIVAQNIVNRLNRGLG